MSDTALIIMARYPEAGKTKTRLARTIGAVEAAQLYQAFLSDLAARFGPSPYTLHWAYTPPDVDYHSFVASLAPEHAASMRCFPQQGADFGTRLLQAFRYTYTQGFEYTILIGSDSPHVSMAIIDNARAALEEADVVLGPADDGGYYLIGMRRPHDVFTSIPMSTSVVKQMTVELAQRQGLTVSLLETLSDVDEWPDLLRLARLLQADRTLAPATAAYIDTIAHIVTRL
ncbi:MAG: TIGR04282 family arsenosugar biosynthesis glycosyltransferase [Ktedonobacteraceae bacterium]|nr:TIGR04282 family arsenosugar biosynthesis glycosyltransferase [Ktedonobacteraceae bacterium]